MMDLGGIFRIFLLPNVNTGICPKCVVSVGLTIYLQIQIKWILFHRFHHVASACFDSSPE